MAAPAVLFAACHVFLSATVTDVGWPLLLFTLYEGLLCAFLRAYRGVLPAALAHGLGIFLLASGLPWRLPDACRATGLVAMMAVWLNRHPRTKRHCNR